MNQQTSKILTVLGYPRPIQVFDRSEFIKCTIWLEDRKIRELDISERDVLRIDSPEYDSEISSYLNRVGCPIIYDPHHLEDAFTWLLSHAIAVEYEDCAEACNNLENSMDAGEDGFDTDIDDLGRAVENLGVMLKLQRKLDEDIPDYLCRINKAIRLFLSPCSALVSSACIEESVSVLDFPLGFDVGDELLNQMCVVLRMLHLWDFRELQTDLNSLIALGQEYTANPKTNTALGKVGR